MNKGWNNTLDDVIIITLITYNKKQNTLFYLIRAYNFICNTKHNFLWKALFPGLHKTMVRIIFMKKKMYG